jgi:hypothetical protein
MSLPEEEAKVDAQIQETDRAIAELQKLKLELLRTKKALRPGKAEQPAAQPVKTEPSDKAVEKAVNMLEWRSFKKKEGEWTFLRDRQGALMPELQGVTEFVDQLRKGKQVVVGKYRYSASEDKFLNRFYASS